MQLQQDPVLDGFSSDDEMREEEVFVHGRPTFQTNANYKEEVRYVVPPAPEIKDKPYPLHPDITAGWVPRILLPNPIPLLYENHTVDVLVRQLLKSQSQTSYKLTYLGPRFQNSYFLHYSRPYRFPYSHIRPPDRLRFTDRPFLGNNPDFCDDLCFDSLFESGNLDCAIKVSHHQYDLFLLVDTNTRGHLQWYNFKVTNAKKATKWKFNVCNFQKAKSLYTRGMKPFVRSKKKGGGWEQAGENLRYEYKGLRYKGVFDSEQKFYRLSFEYTFDYADDQVQFAYCVPYEYTTLMKWIQTLSSKSSNYLKISKLCNSLGALQVPLLTIHQPLNKPIQHSKSVHMHQSFLQKTSSQQTLQSHQQHQQQQQQQPPQPSVPTKCVVISGRAHPGESNGSFMMQGFLEFLCGPTPAAEYLRRRVVWKVVPMLNPDGVVAGNYRTGLSGKDFNREFLNPDRFVFPEIIALKELVSKCKQQFRQNLLLFLDFHGHSIKKNVFMYGPQFPITQRYYYQSKILPRLISRQTQMFRYHSCIFRVSSFKQTTARAILSKKLDVPFSYTIEASNGSYFQREQMRDVSFTPKLWLEMGGSVGMAMYEYCSALVAAEEVRVEKARERQAMMILRKKRSMVESKRNKLTQRSSSRRNSQRIPDQLKPPNPNSNPNPKPSPTKKPPPPIISDILSSGLFQDLVAEIKHAQQPQTKQNQKASDDQLSQGSSDQQQQTDDLSPEKMRKLYRMIGCKKFQGFEKCRLTTKSPEKGGGNRQVLSKLRVEFQEEEGEGELGEMAVAKGSCERIILGGLNQFERELIEPDRGDREEEEEEERDEEVSNQQLPAVFTNRGRGSLRQKISRRQQMQQSLNNTIKNRPTAKINNISFFNPFWQDQRKTVGTPNPTHKLPYRNPIMVDSLRRTYNIYKDVTLRGLPCGPPPQTQSKRSSSQRKSLIHSAMYAKY